MSGGLDEWCGWTTVATLGKFGLAVLPVEFWSAAKPKMERGL